PHHESTQRVGPRIPATHPICSAVSVSRCRCPGRDLEASLSTGSTHGRARHGSPRAFERGRRKYSQYGGERGISRRVRGHARAHGARTHGSSRGVRQAGAPPPRGGGARVAMSRSVSVEIAIDQVTVEGFGSLSVFAFKMALQRELTRLVQERGV